MPDSTGASARAPSKLFDIEYYDAAGSSLSISPDGNRVLVQEPTEVSSWEETPMTLDG